MAKNGLPTAGETSGVGEYGSEKNGYLKTRVDFGHN